ncbi:hypothetical protein GH714_040307 [Hevea brasiliensis]|uniref:Major facilitator superfamily (MFS) profile domain-containing protein n=1 Tax=Hevea brasiliensis TaxID=3981 RepID=A0A6A6MUZ7_HEVBR|nr:hypothetical protein GH714_040307 [Hevea brasiliensis]
MGPLSEPVPERNQNKLYGIQFLEFVKKDRLSYKTYQAIVLIITFFAYASYHAARKTTSIVKSTLDPQSTEVGLKFIPWRITYLSEPEERRGFSWALGDGWTPFNGSDGTALLGDLDLAFLSIYAIAMYFSGHIVNWMAFSGCCGRKLVWEKQERTNYGYMECSYSVGNISGSLIASAMLSYGWGWSFVVPGFLIAFIGLVVFLVLPVSPESVGIDRNEDELHYPKKTEEEVTEPLLGSDSKVKETAVGFIEAWKIPGVAPFALCLFFAKLVAYTFLYWLPFYISHTAINGKYLSSGTAGNLSTLFDVGGVIGGILAGHISDRLDARAITAASFMYCAIPALLLPKLWTYFLGSVSADLGTHSSLKGNSRALATVTAIIDGTGSVGAAIGPLLTGYISEKSWSAVFTMLMGAALIAGLLLTRLVMAEVAAKIAESRPQTSAASRTPAVPQLDV